MIENKSPKVSVCIPVYNNYELIRETLDSILNQTYKDFEIIVIDDGSPDEKTWEAISSYGHPVRAFRQQNKGIPATRNACVEKSRGEYIAFCDHDDLWAPTKLEEQLKYLTNPDIGFVGTSVKTFGGKKDRIIPDLRITISQDLFTECLKEKLKILPSTLVIRKTVFEKVGKWNPSFPIYEDMDFFLRLTYMTRGIIVRKMLVYYRFHASNTSTAKKTISREMFKRIYNNWLASGKLTKQQKDIARKQIAKRYYFPLSGDAWHNGNITESVRLLQEARKLDPFNFRYIKRMLNLKIKLLFSS